MLADSDWYVPSESDDDPTPDWWEGWAAGAGAVASGWVALWTSKEVGSNGVVLYASADGAWGSSGSGDW